MDLKRSAKKRLNKIANRLGFQPTPPKSDFVLHEFSSYEDYRSTQVAANESKLHQVWADSDTLDRVVKRINTEFSSNELTFGLCHGTRNGFEQNYISEKLKIEIIGTDISPSATQFPNSVVWDFHEENEEWVGKCDFIYSNSIDQSWKPKLALSTWIKQLRIGGLLFLEHSKDQSVESASERDPFGVNLNYFPYLLCGWFGHDVAIEIIHGKKGASTSWKQNVGMPTALLVIKRLR